MSASEMTPELITPLKAVRLLMAEEAVVVRNETWEALTEQLAAERARAEAAEAKLATTAANIATSGARVNVRAAAI